MYIKIQSNINTSVFPFHSPFPPFFIISINSWCIIVHSTIENTINARYNTLKNTFLQKIYNWSGVQGNFYFRQIFPKIEKQESTMLFICCCSVPQACPTLSDPMDCSTPDLPVLHYLPEFTQTHVHWVNDAIQPIHFLTPPLPPTLNLSQHQGLFKWVSSLHQVAKVLEFQLPINVQDWFPVGWTSWISLLSKELSRIFSYTTIQKHQLFGAQLPL